MQVKTVSLIVVLTLCIAVPVMGAITLPKTGQTKCYSGSSETPCAGTGQDGEEQRGVAWPDPRFSITYCDNGGTCKDQSKDCDWISGNNLVTDHLTGLQWMGGPVFYPEYGTERKLTWEEALDLTLSWTTCGGIGGWRVPNIVELLSLSSYGTDARPPVGIGYYSWSGTTNQGETESAWVGYDSGRDIGMASAKKTGTNYATFVRGSGGLVLLPQTGQTVSYHSLDDGALKQGTAWPTPRFTDNLDTTFTDQLTGIRWYKEVTAGWWGGVLNSAKSKNDQNYLCSNQWAVPNINELRSLFDYGQYSPALPAGHLFNLPYEYGSHYVWSSTTNDDTPGSAFTVKRRDAYVTSTPKGYQDGYLGFLMVQGTTPLCLYTLTVDKAGSGTGTVTSNPGGVNCGATCAATYGGSTVVTLAAAPAQGSVFAGWSGGGCAGTGNCVVTMNAHATVAATFDLAPVPVTLSVSKTGSGTGTVTSAPAGIACGAACSAAYDPGTVVALTATAEEGSVFTGWSGGGCAGAGQCVVTVNTDVAVSAQFDIAKTLTVVKSGAGVGTVTSVPAGIACGEDCSESYAQGTVVTLAATASTGALFGGWSGGGCSGKGVCAVTLGDDTTVTANFVPAYTLTVTRQGSGAGRVTSDPAGINCGTECTFTYVTGVEVTLTATPDPGFVFAGWTGCDSTIGNACTVTMVINKFVYATFSPAKTLTVVKSGAGTGTVASTPPGIDCGSDCSEGYVEGAIVTLTAVSSAGSVFTGWSGGGCSGAGACTVMMGADITVDASFEAAYTLTVTKSGTGVGNVTSSPTGINCGTNCSKAYIAGTSVALTATAAAGSSFTGWSGGGCSGTGICTVVMNADVSVNAAFITTGPEPLDTWNERDPGVYENLWAAAYGAGSFVAVGEGGIVVTSSTGLSWTSRSAGTSNDLLGLAYLNGIFVAVGQHDTILTSADGMSWSSHTATSAISAFDTTLYSVAHGNDRYVAVGKGSVVATSTNGAAWSLTSIPGPVDLYGVAYGSGTFVAVGPNGLIMTTTNGTSWEARTSATSEKLWFVAFGGGLFVAVGENGTVLTSPNGADWTPRTSGIEGPLWSVTYGHNTFTAVGPYGAIITSPDGITWTKREAGTSLYLYGVGFGRETFMAVGEYGMVLQSDPLGSPSEYTLSVGKVGTGSGTVTSEPAGISCGSGCSAAYVPGTSVTLTAIPAAGSTFTGWSGGGCSGEGACTVTLDADKYVAATFMVPVHTLTVTKAGAGSGIVSSSPSGISCGSDCSEAYPEGTSVTLTAIAAAGSSFTGWSGGGCSGTGTCVVTMGAATTVTAEFALLPCIYTLKPTSKAYTANGGSVTVTVTGKGQTVCPSPVVSAPGWVTTVLSPWTKNKGTVKLTVTKNSSSFPKSGTVTIGGTPFPVTQAGTVCAIKKFVPASQSVGKMGGSSSFAVEAAPQDCAWTTTVSTAALPWLHITSGTGTGNGTVEYGVDENPGKMGRNGTITVVLTQNSKKKAFTVRQANK